MADPADDKTQEQTAASEPRKLRLSLLDNAYDSLNDSLGSADLAEEDVRGWKLAIFLLVHALELMMKERLRREHRLLVYTNVDKPRNTVSMEVALERLQSVGVAIDQADVRAIQTAIGWRDRIAHYEVDLDVDDLAKIYALLFEFAHTFHLRELGEDLHPHIDEHNWWKEAELIELFRTEYVEYNGALVIRSWPTEIVSAQQLKHVEVEGKPYDRIAYGSEPMWLEVNPTYASHPCHDCGIVAGQLHVPNCDMEQCPRCNDQFITCGC